MNICWENPSLLKIGQEEINTINIAITDMELNISEQNWRDALFHCNWKHHFLRSMNWFFVCTYMAKLCKWNALLYLHGNISCMNAAQCYVIHTLAILFDLFSPLLKICLVMS